MVCGHPLALWMLEVPQQSSSSFRNTKPLDLADCKDKFLVQWVRH